MEDEVASVRSRTAGMMTALIRNGRDREPVMGHARLERVFLFGTRSADYIRASGHTGCIRGGRGQTNPAVQRFLAAP